MQLSGFDSIDYRTKVDAQHIIRPETLHSTFDKPASITGQSFSINHTGQFHISMIHLLGSSKPRKAGFENVILHIDFS